MKGKHEGRGRLTYSNGNEYVGQLHQGRLEGRGRMVEASGTRLEG